MPLWHIHSRIMEAFGIARCISPLSDNARLLLYRNIFWLIDLSSVSQKIYFIANCKKYTSHHITHCLHMPVVNAIDVMKRLGNVCLEWQLHFSTCTWKELLQWHYIFYNYLIKSFTHFGSSYKACHLLDGCSLLLATWGLGSRLE